MNNENEIPASEYANVKAYIVAFNAEPGGTINIRARSINKTLDLFEPQKGFDVLLPAGVVQNFEELGDALRGETPCDGYDIKVLKSFVERHGTIADHYDSDNKAPSKHSRRSDEWWPDDALDL